MSAKYVANTYEQFSHFSIIQTSNARAQQNLAWNLGINWEVWSDVIGFETVVSIEMEKYCIVLFILLWWWAIEKNLGRNAFLPAGGG